MSTDTLLEFNKGILESLFRVGKRMYERPFSSADARILSSLRQSRRLLDMISTMRDKLTKLLDKRGMDPGQFRAACVDSLAALDVLAKGLQGIRKLPIKAEKREEVTRQENMAEELQKSFSEWLKALDRPFAPIDLKRLEEEARADVEAGRMVRVESFGDLFPSHPDEG